MVDPQPGANRDAAARPVSASAATERPTRVPSNPKAEVTELVDMVKAYAVQETVGPLRNAGRWIGLGAVGALLLGLGLALLLLGLLRLLQTETGDVFDGAWSWVPYTIVLVISLIVIAISLSRVKKSTLAKEPR
jgi:hypothetical protein